MASTTIARGPISARRQWEVLLLLAISVCINYIDRGNLSIALMDLKNELHLEPLALGNLLAAFFWSYAGFMVLAGWIVEKYNVIWVYAIGFFFWSLATALTGTANGFMTLFGLRLLLGISESVAYPSYSKVIASGFAEHQRGFANGLIDAGSKLGPALGIIVGGSILAHFGWRMLFVAVGAASMVWLIPWCLLAPGVETNVLLKRDQAPSFREILSKRDAWASFFCLFCGNYGWYFMLTWIPGYLRMERHYSAEEMALAGSLPFWAVAAGSMIGGYLSDAWIRNGGSPTKVRKTFTAGGMAISAVFLFPSAVAPNAKVAMALLVVASFVYGLYSSNLWTITQTLAGPAAAGKWTGLQNCVGNMAGVAAPTVTGFLVEKTGSFYFAFVWVCGCLLIGALSFVFLIGKVRQVSWTTD